MVSLYHESYDKQALPPASPLQSLYITGSQKNEQKMHEAKTVREIALTIFRYWPTLSYYNNKWGGLPIDNEFNNVILRSAIK